MFKSRRQKCEEEAKKDPNYIKTKDLEIDPNLLDETQKMDMAKKGIPIVPIIVIGAIVLLMIICIIVIMVNGGPLIIESSSNTSSIVR